MTTATNTTNSFPWKAIARLLGVTLVMSAKATWWLAKHGAVILGTIFGFLFVVGKAIAEVSLDDEDGEKKNTDSMYAEEGELGMDENDQTSFNGANRLKVL